MSAAAGRAAARALLAAAAIAAGLAAAAAPAAAESKAGAIAYRGVVIAGPEAGIAPGDRLALKLHHPGARVELDVKYTIVPEFAPPLAFAIAPAIDMAGHTKWRRYVVSAFTDRDGDLTTLVPGEAAARTAEPLPLGTTGIELRLEPVAR